ncbi:MAG: carbohydrate kinase family protein [Actinobacteria bacterium]|nr:carbohydrate kinase family protein [Actinomycetota bacterium]
MGWAQRWLQAEATRRPRLLVVGGASLDIIHVGGRPTATPGGAGLYTALAANRAGADVTMLAPLPNPMPPELAPALDRIRWIGPTVSIDGLPRFEIAYDVGGAVTLFREYLGAEPQMTPELLDSIDELPGCAYCVPFLDARLQQSFVRALAARGCLTVASTYGKAVRSEPDIVRETQALADMFFCNEDEAGLLFGSEPDDPPAGRVRYVTRGAHGATVHQGNHRTPIDGMQVAALDPTGAGDTFCGTTIARLLAGDHPVEAARRGNAAAAEMVTMVGPAALWAPGPPPSPTADARARVDSAAVQRLAALMRDLPGLDSFAFADDLFPAVGEPSAIDWFAAATLQQFGFWFAADGRYTRPMIAPIDGHPRKGSDYLWAHYLRWQRADVSAMTAARQASLTFAEWARMAADDEGRDPYPDSNTCVALARDFGNTLITIGVSPTELVAAAATTSRPMRSLLRLLDHVGGYREDPYRKKAALLGVILRQRPEAWLPGIGGDDAPPIVDYHVQRTSLRTGIVTIDDASLRQLITERRLLHPDDEDAVRRATFAAVGELADASGQSMGAVDWFLFQMRHRCPEMTTPRCSACPAEAGCAQRTELFQPVLRTTAY